MAKPRRMRAYPVTVARARRQAEMEQTMRTWSEQLARIKELETERNGAIDDVMRAEADRDSQRRRGNAYRNRALALVRQVARKREVATAIKSLKYEQEDGRMTVEMRAEFVRAISIWLCQWFVDSGGKNYIEMTIS